MLKIIWFSISLILIFIIFFNMPKELTGLSGFMGKSKSVNSSSFSRTFINRIIGLLTIFYLILTFYLD